MKKKELGNRFSSVSIRNMRKFYEIYPIWSTVSTELSWTYFQERIKIDKNIVILIIFCDRFIKVITMLQPLQNLYQNIEKRRIYYGKQNN